MKTVDYLERTCVSIGLVALLVLSVNKLASGAQEAIVEVGSADSPCQAQVGNATITLESPIDGDNLVPRVALFRWSALQDQPVAAYVICFAQEILFSDPPEFRDVQVVVTDPTGDIAPQVALNFGFEDPPNPLSDLDSGQDIFWRVMALDGNSDLIAQSNEASFQYLQDGRGFTVISGLVQSNLDQAAIAGATVRAQTQGDLSEVFQVATLFNGEYIVITVTKIDGQLSSSIDVVAESAGFEPATITVQQGEFDPQANHNAITDKDILLEPSGIGPGDVVVAGRLGVGTAAPQRAVHLVGSNAVFRMDRDSDTAAFLIVRTSPDGSEIWKSYVVGVNANGLGDGSFVINDIGSAAGGGGTRRLTISNSGNVGIGTSDPQGLLDVDGAIVQRGGQLHADYVFEPAFNLETIEDHEQYMWENKHLTAIPQSRKDEGGLEVVEIGAHRRGIVEELEKAHIYIAQLNRKNRLLRETHNALREQLKAATVSRETVLELRRLICRQHIQVEGCQ